MTEPSTERRVLHIPPRREFVDAATSEHDVEYASVAVYLADPDDDTDQDVEEHYAVCSCGWDTGKMRLYTGEQTHEAGLTHQDVMQQVAQYADIIAVYREHVPGLDTAQGGLSCSCDWHTVGFPIGAETAYQRWLVHFAETMAQVM